MSCCGLARRRNSSSRCAAEPVEEARDVPFGVLLGVSRLLPLIWPLTPFDVPLRPAKLLVGRLVCSFDRPQSSSGFSDRKGEELTWEGIMLAADRNRKQRAVQVKRASTDGSRKHQATHCAMGCMCERKPYRHGELKARDCAIAALAIPLLSNVQWLISGRHPGDGRSAVAGMACLPRRSCGGGMALEWCREAEKSSQVHHSIDW